MVLTRRFPVLLMLCQMFSGLIAKQCSRQVSVYGMMLQRHIFKIVETSNTLEFLTACNDEKRCQSFNFVVSKNICEMNNRTKKARPEDFVPDSDRYYYGTVRNRGLLLVREREKVKHFEREMLTFLTFLLYSVKQALDNIFYCYLYPRTDS